ncbi:MAG: threonylcarbamoyl-AMP synthase [Rhodospirillales bacterium]|nr:threonylcarbamoyl-AMP synthase [Rhodospirillales bacterium]
MIATADPDSIQKAATLLRQGRLVAFPTETVYGLGANATDDVAVAAIFAAKNRPDFNPLIVHFTDIDAAADAVIFDDRARRVAQAFWPGALTLVLPRRSGCRISLLTSAGLDTLAVRVPSQPVAQALFKAASLPIAAPSANRSFSVSPTVAAHVAEDLTGRIDFILDDGPCPVGLESTVIDLSTETPTLLRPGGIPSEDIEAVTGPLAKAGNGAPKSPGMLSRHYAPARPLRLDVLAPRTGEAFLAFGSNANAATLNLSESGNLGEAAANLFAMMRALDRDEFVGIAVAPVPERGLGRAVNDRLRRAATPATQDCEKIGTP